MTILLSVFRDGTTSLSVPLNRQTSIINSVSDRVLLTRCVWFLRPSFMVLNALHQLDRWLWAVGVVFLSWIVCWVTNPNQKPPVVFKHEIKPPNCHHYFLQLVSCKHMIFLWLDCCVYISLIRLDCCCVFIFFLFDLSQVYYLYIFLWVIFQVYFRLFISCVLVA